MADLSKIILPNNSELTLKDNSQEHSAHNHYDSDIVPLIHKKYESTSYYATTNDWENATWYFMSVIPDDWNKPWRVKIKLHSYCPDYTTYQSYTWATIYGRMNDWSYVNYNERNYRAHNYVAIYRLKKAGFDAGYGHAIGVSIYNSDTPTNSAYYRTFEVDYYTCENCTVTLLDTPVKWANWSGGSTTNYESLTYSDAATRGLCETNDANDGRYYVERIYSSIKAGSNKIFPYTFIMQNSDDRWESIVTSSTTATTKTKNSHGFRLGSIFYQGSANTTEAGAVVANYSLYEQHGNLIDHRYSFNTENNATNGLTANLPVYLIGTLGNDGLFYLSDKWWGQELPSTEDGKLYIQLGAAYDRYRMVLDNKHPIYRYVNGAIREFTQDSDTVDGHTVSTDVPSGAVFTDTKNTTGSTDTSNKIYLIGATEQSANPQTYSDDQVYATNGVLNAKNFTVTNPNGRTVVAVIYDSTNNGQFNVFDSSGQGTVWASGKSGQLNSKSACILSTVSGYSTRIIHKVDAADDYGISEWRDTNGTTNVTITGEGDITCAGAVTATSGFVGDLTGDASTVNNHTVNSDVPANAVFTDTKNTAGSTDTSNKIYLIGATEQAANPQTYSDNEVYATSGVLTTKSIQVGSGAATMQYNATTKAVDFIFT